MPAAGFHAHAAQIVGNEMRSLLFVPADGGSKLDKAFSSGADAVIVDLEDSIAPGRKTAARALAASFLQAALATSTRPRLLVRINALATGLADADLDAIVPARPDAILLPKAEGAAAVAEAAAKLTAREAAADITRGHVKIVAQAIETAAGIFIAGTFRGATVQFSGGRVVIDPSAGRIGSFVVDPGFLECQGVAIHGVAAAMLDLDGMIGNDGI